MTNIPSSVVWFGVTAFIAIVYGLQLGHIYAVGFDAYINELIKKFDLTAKEAEKEARQTFWVYWFIVLACGIAATVLLAISVKNMFKF